MPVGGSPGDAGGRLCLSLRELCEPFLSRLWRLSLFSCLGALALLALVHGHHFRSSENSIGASHYRFVEVSWSRFGVETVGSRSFFPRALARSGFL
jgi:hypothetical protein